jgi:type IV secretion system protein VirB4
LRINQALANLGSGWMIHVDAIRRDAPSYSEWASRISRTR